MCLVEVTPGTEQGGASAKARTLGFAPGDGGRREAERAQEEGRGSGGGAGLSRWPLSATGRPLGWAPVVGGGAGLGLSCRRRTVSSG